MTSPTQSSEARRSVGPLRVLFLRSSRWYGGIERQMLWHASRLQAQGWTVHVAALFRGVGEHPMALRARAAGLPATTIPDPAAWHPAAWRATQRLIAQFQPDILHTADYRTDCLAACLSPRSARWLAETQGHTQEGWRMRFWNRVDVWALKRAHRVVPVSLAWETALAARGVSPARLILLENSRAILRSPPPPEPASLQGPGPHLLFAGRLSPEKGIGFLLSAWPSIRKNWPKAILWVLGGLPPGGGFRRRLHSWLQQPGVHYLGHRPDIRPWLVAVDAVIVPSLREAWGMTAFETLCAGAPLVASRVGGLPSLCRNAPHAKLFTPNERCSLIRSLDAVLASDFPRGPEVGRGYCTQPRFDPERRHQTLLRTYRHLVVMD